MSNQTPNWDSFTKRIHLQKSMEEVYRAWAVPDLLTQWFLQEAHYTTPEDAQRPAGELIQKGDRHRWKWHNWDVREEGEVLEANGRDRLSFTFGHGGQVHLQLRENARGTELELTQNEIPTDEQAKMNYYVGCSTGWTFWLTNLKAWLEYGITLHATGLSPAETPNLVNS